MASHSVRPSFTSPCRENGPGHPPPRSLLQASVSTPFQSPQPSSSSSVPVSIRSRMELTPRRQAPGGLGVLPVSPIFAPTTVSAASGPHEELKCGFKRRLGAQSAEPL